MEIGKPVRVAIYARVSTEEQAEHGYSIDAQLDTLRQYCQQTDKQVAGEYVDRGVSGKEMTRRLELKRMLRDADNLAFDEVLVWKINRLSRKTKDLLEIVERLDKNNIYFRSFSENFETETPMGRFALQMLGAVGELERNTIVENVKLGMKQRARMGLWNGGLVLGYRHVQDNTPTRKGGNRSIEIVPAEAVTVRKIFEWYLLGKGLRAIANRLNREGYRTKRGNTFSTDSVKEILHNPIYTGIVRYNRFEGWSEKRRRGKNSNPIMVEGKHEPIIERELWQKVQEMIALKSKVNPRVYDGVSLLTGLLRCPRCGAIMVASRTVNRMKDGTKVVRRYYSCGRFRSQGSSVCGANSVRAGEAEQTVLKRIRKVVNHPTMIADVTQKINQKWASGTGAAQKELECLEANLANIAKKKGKVMEAYEAEAIDREALFTRMDELKTEEEALLKRQNELSASLIDGPPRMVQPEEVEALLSQFNELLSKSPPEQQKLLLQSVIDEIEVKPKRQLGKIVMRFDTKSIENRNDLSDQESCRSFHFPLVIEI